MWSTAPAISWGRLLNLRGSLRSPAGTPVGSRRYWWGHDTLEDKELRKELAEQKQMVRWTTPGRDVKEKHKFSYLPSRIYDEASTLQDKPMIRFNKADYYQWIRKPRMTFLWDNQYYMEDRIKSRYRSLVRSQVFVRERVLTLGPDLAAAHFLVHRNCRVRFKGHDHWTELDKYQRAPFPNSYEPGWYLEAIDAAESDLIYEGLQNLRNLVFLRHLDISYCPHVDSWFLDRITGEYKDSLEFLDLSGCPGVNWHGLECLWRLKRLKTLVLYDLEHVKDIELLCILLLEIFPNLDIRGVDYIDPKLLEGTEHEHLLLELDELQSLPQGEWPTSDNLEHSAENTSPSSKQSEAKREKVSQRTTTTS